jgi:tetraacyldisaccharide 4'-kinase
MSKVQRPYLYPLTLLYKGIGNIRNMLYDKEIIKSKQFDIPVISVGNLRVGGTGKSPMVDYLVRLLKNKYRIGVLSRGYKRKTNGFILAHSEVAANDIGDESYQLYRKHPDILIAVDEKRAHGIELLLNSPFSPQLILLDDAFQHRSVFAGLHILLTPYDDLYTDDEVLPAGNLRESVKGAGRAQIIVVTKCPENLNEQEQFLTAKKLNAGLNQTVFFSKVIYSNFVFSTQDKIPLNQLSDYQVVLITGIAKPEDLLKKLESLGITFQHFSFPDHHNFTKKEIQHIQKTFDDIKTKKKIILTTEKDYVRIFDRLDNIYYIPIQTDFISHREDFDKMILQYVEQYTRNS